MSKFRQYTEESRNQILKAITNQSTSKQAWSFSKQKRFIMPAPNCPYISYNTKNTTLSDRKASFGNSRRRVFTQTTQGPCSWVYKPNSKTNATTISFGHGREEIVANSYIRRDPLKNPGPGRYQSGHEARHGYTMRPKTANHRNYFIQDKQMQKVPGPGNYDDQSSKMGKSLVSKFKSVILGGSMTSKTKRFLQSEKKTPSAWDYNSGKSISFISKNAGSSKIGAAERSSFIDYATRSSYTPGPGNYRLPTQFAHYKKIPHYN